VNSDLYRGGTFLCAICNKFAFYQGGPYGFSDRMRGSESLPEDCQEPYTFLSKDEHDYDIKDMDSSMLDDLIEVTANGTAGANLPRHFQKLRRRD
jgi:hypothetical protein